MEGNQGSYDGGRTWCDLRKKWRGNIHWISSRGLCIMQNTHSKWETCKPCAPYSVSRGFVYIYRPVYEVRRRR
jgi:hypothetical protein